MGGLNITIIRKARKRKRLTLIQLSKEIGASKSAYAEYEKGLRPMPAELAYKLIELLGLSNLEGIFKPATFFAMEECKEERKIESDKICV